MSAQVCFTFDGIGILAKARDLVGVWVHAGRGDRVSQEVGLRGANS